MQLFPFHILISYCKLHDGELDAPGSVPPTGGSVSSETEETFPGLLNNQVTHR